MVVLIQECEQSPWFAVRICINGSGSDSSAELSVQCSASMMTILKKPN